MVDFNYYTPTEVMFGKNAEDSLPSLVRKYGGTKVLIHYGSGSVVRSGLLQQTKQRLDASGIPWVELGGVVPNPQLELVYKGIELCREQGVDMILAVGGGSVIDSAKGISYGLANPGTDIWDMFFGKVTPTRFMPVGSILTIPAAGSEMSWACVLSKGEVKRGYDNDIARPKFAILNPERTYTLPPYQTACGVTDIMMHTMERYFSNENDMYLTDAIAEGLMRTVRICGEAVLKDPENYVLRAQIMWAGSLSHNNLTGCGLIRDFGTHRLEHELSGLFGVAHGAGLAALWCHWAEYVLNINPGRFAQFAVKVMDIDPAGKTEEQTALEGIDAVKDFYHRIGMPASIPELIGRRISEDEIKLMAERCSLAHTITVGNLLKLDYDRMIDVYRLANRAG